MSGGQKKCKIKVNVHVNFNREGQFKRLIEHIHESLHELSSFQPDNLGKSGFGSLNKLWERKSDVLAKHPHLKSSHISFTEISNE